MIFFSLFVLLLVLLETAQDVLGSNYTDEKKLFSHLFDNYNKELHPVNNANGKRNVIVNLDVQVIRVLHMNEIDQTIEVYTWINQYWGDPQLKWMPKKFGGITNMYVGAHMIWTPDIVLYNNVGAKSKQLGDTDGFTGKVKIHFDGNISWLNPAMLRSICRIDVSHFPFDDQCCTLKFGSWSFDASKIDLIASESLEKINSYYIKNGEWQLLSIKAKRNTLYYQCCDEPFVDISIYLRLRRHALNYCLNLIVPCALLSSLVILGYILPPESGERIGLTVALLLSVTVFQQLSNQFMPSYDFPFLAQYYWATIMQTGMSLVVTTVILHCYHRNQRKMHWLVRKVFLVYINQLIFCQKKSNDDESSEEELMDKFNYCQMNESFNSQRRQSIAVSSYRQNGHTLSPHSEVNRSVSENSLPLDNLRRSSDNNGAYLETSLSQNILTPGKSFKGRERKKSRKKALEKRKKDWLKVARILDRLFMFLSMITFFMTVLCVFVRAPRFIGKEPVNVCTG